MKKHFYLFLACFLFLANENFSQHIYYKNPDAQLIRQFGDTANRVINVDSNSLIKKQFKDEQKLCIS